MDTSDGGVEFHENEGFDEIPIPRPEPHGLVYRLMHAGIATSPAEAAIVLALFAAVLISANIYLFAKAVPEQPRLGPDVIRPGELVPAYSNQR